MLNWKLIRGLNEADAKLLVLLDWIQTVMPLANDIPQEVPRDLLHFDANNQRALLSWKGIGRAVELESEALSDGQSVSTDPPFPFPPGRLE